MLGAKVILPFFQESGERRKIKIYISLATQPLKHPAILVPRLRSMFGWWHDGRHRVEAVVARL